MADYKGVYLTKKGLDLLLKAQSGVNLNFTKFVIGDGQHDQSEDIENLESLLNPIKDLWITGIQVESDRCRIHSAINNEGVTEGFYIWELGLYANDPDHGEILYAIALAEKPDYLPANGGTTAVNSEFEINIYVSSSVNITANISNLGYVSQEEFNRWVLRLDATDARSIKNAEDISTMKLRLANIEQSFFNNFTSNHFTEDLTTLDDVIVTRGVYDSVNKRLVV